MPYLTPPRATSTNNNGSTNVPLNSPPMPKKATGEVDEDATILSILSSRFLRHHWAKECLFWLVNLLTAGLVSLLCRWYPSLLIKLRYKEVSSQDRQAELVLVESVDRQASMVPILTLDPTDLTNGKPACLPACHFV